MSLYIPPVTPPAPPAPANQMAQNIRDTATNLSVQILSAYGAAQGYLNNTQITTKTAVVAALGADAVILNTMSANMRSLLVALDSSLGAKFDALTIP